MGLKTAEAEWSDQEVAEHIQKTGEREYIGPLYKRHQRAVRAAVRAVLSVSAEADQTAQEQWCKAIERIEQYEGGSFKSWMTRGARNAALDRIRKEGRRRDLRKEHGTGPLLGGESQRSNPENEAALIERLNQWDAITTEEDQDLMERKHVDGRPARVVAEETETPLGTIQRASWELAKKFKSFVKN